MPTGVAVRIFGITLARSPRARDGPGFLRSGDVLRTPVQYERRRIHAGRDQYGLTGVCTSELGGNLRGVEVCLRPGRGDGALEVEKATVAEKAYRLASPMTITFTGDAQGAVSFDGSGNVTATLSVRNGSVDVSDLVNDSLNALIRDKNSILMKKVQSMIDEAISYHVNKSGWHVSQDRGGN